MIASSVKQSSIIGDIQSSLSTCVYRVRFAHIDQDIRSNTAYRTSVSEFPSILGSCKHPCCIQAGLGDKVSTVPVTLIVFVQRSDVLVQHGGKN